MESVIKYIYTEDNDEDKIIMETKKDQNESPILRSTKL